MRSVCFKNLHYQGVFWPPPRAWPSNSAQHFGSPCLLDFFYRFVEFDIFFLKIWARLEIFCFELLIFCYGLKFLKLHKGAACAQLVRARVQLVRTRAQLVRARAQLVRARAQLKRARAQLVCSLCAQGRSLCAQGRSLCAGGRSLCAGGRSLCAQGRSLCAASTPFRSTFAADARL